jgi:ABC-type oligopeptide transport system substrate-binding subunit
MGYLEQFSDSAGPRNITRYADPDFDQRLVAADSVLDDATRPPFTAAAEGVLIQDQVIFPIFFYRPRHAVAARVQGWEANASGIHLLRYLSLQTTKRLPPVQ